jgi:hypothetical protein
LKKRSIKYLAAIVAIFSAGQDVVFTFGVKGHQPTIDRRLGCFTFLAIKQ